MFERLVVKKLRFLFKEYMYLCKSKISMFKIVTSCGLHDSFLSKRSGHRHDSWGDRVGVI